MVERPIMASTIRNRACAAAHPCSAKLPARWLCRKWLWAPLGRVALLSFIAALAIPLSTANAQVLSSPKGASEAAQDSPPPEGMPEVTLPEVVVRLPKSGKQFREEASALDKSRDEFLLPKLGADSSSLDRDSIQSLPQGDDAPLDSVLLQLPGVSNDSTMSSVSFHVRNEYGNVQYRIDGVQLPDGLSGFANYLDTGIIGGLRLLDGALPAQYGLRTAGVIDITTRSEYPPRGLASLNLGTDGTLSPGLEYGGQAGPTQYFLAGHYVRSDEGLENAMPTVHPLHDQTEQGRAFGYQSTLFGASTRLTSLAGLSLSRFQIPDYSGEVPLGDYGSSAFPSSQLNENQAEQYAFAVVALQTAGEHHAAQLSLSSRYATVHFLPDPYGDLVFNDVASDVSRQSLLVGSQLDWAYHAAEWGTVRAGYGVTTEGTRVDNRATVLPTESNGSVLPTPVTLDDFRAGTGWMVGGYVEGEVRMASHLTVNVGLRYDWARQFVTASQLSPRAVLLYQLSSGTTLHAGYARYFTPPMQAEATPANLALFRNTTLQPTIAADSPVRPERSHYFDLGAETRALEGLHLAASVYYKRTSDMLDDGQFGEAVVLTQLNYAVSFSRGAELSADYVSGPVKFYASASLNTTRARGVATNQYLFDPEEYAYLQTHDHVTDDAQTITASAGASYSMKGALLSADCIYGSGLPSGFANTGHVPGHAVLNTAIGKEFDAWGIGKPLALRLSLTNALDTTYLIRSGTGIGQEAPQYGARRGLFLTVSQSL